MLNPLLQMLLVMVAGWVNRQQLDVIEYLKEENRVLRELHGKRRLRFNDDQRRRLAVKGKTLGRRLPAEACGVVTSDTILRWHRRLIAPKYDGTAKLKLSGRPRVVGVIRELTLSMAAEDESRGYSRIQGALTNLGHYVSR